MTSPEVSHMLLICIMRNVSAFQIMLGIYCRKNYMKTITNSNGNLKNIYFTPSHTEE
jgi:hypothetical protein